MMSVAGDPRRRPRRGRRHRRSSRTRDGSADGWGSGGEAVGARRPAGPPRPFRAAHSGLPSRGCRHRAAVTGLSLRGGRRFGGLSPRVVARRVAAPGVAAPGVSAPGVRKRAVLEPGSSTGARSDRGHSPRPRGRSERSPLPRLPVCSSSFDGARSSPPFPPPPACRPWSQRWDSNPRPPDYKSGALPLSYAGPCTGRRRGDPPPTPRRAARALASAARSSSLATSGARDGTPRRARVKGGSNFTAIRGPRRRATAPSWNTTLPGARPYDHAPAQIRARVRR